ncbi:MAG: hypothetical protein GY786_13070 [Proteobacteria bacterium]|nr:hypothetical protein [Pseudomonadota bacterium]
MELSKIIRKYEVELLTDTSKPPLSSQQIKALHDIRECRSEDSEEITAYCPCCGLEQKIFHSCGHRNCPKCQSHDTTKWLERQKSKLLPVFYFMVTFTIALSPPGLSPSYLFHNSCGRFAHKEGTLEIQFIKIPGSRSQIPSTL